MITLVIAGLLAVVAFIQPVAAGMRLPPSVLLAAVGVAIGFVAGFLYHTPLTDAFNSLVAPFVDLPLRSATFIYVFLPLLLFQASLTIDVRRMMEDAAPILLLAVVAVIVATGVIGFGLWWMFGVSLIACLLLGSIVATTDPGAVVAIFRDIGAPARLTRLVEGESLLNDAAAIALFTLLLGILVSGGSLDPIEGAVSFSVSFLGGIALGAVGGKILLLALPRLGGSKAAEATLTLAVPYLVFILGDQVLGVSGVVAVVVVGLTVSAFGRSCVSPDNWNHLHNVWEQVAFWAGSLVFLLASILVPRLLGAVSWLDVSMVLAVVVLALLARAAVIFLLLPFLSLARLSEKVSHAYKGAILWGGLRGAVTLALALAVTESTVLSPDIKRFVAVTATGFVLFTLFVNGTTLRLVIRKLGLDRLSPVDQGLRNQVFALALADVRDGVQEVGRRFEIEPTTVRAVLKRYDERVSKVAAQGSIEENLSERERLNVGLLALANREKELILDGHGYISPAVGTRLLRHAERLVEGARANGRVGYNRAARVELEFRRPFKVAHFLHRRLRIDRPLTRQVADRFEILLTLRLVLSELKRYNEQRLRSLLGQRMSEIIGEILDARATATAKALDALQLQYPDYAEALERRFLRQVGLRMEMTHYESLRREGLLGQELHESLRQGVQLASQIQSERPRLDLRLNTEEMLDQVVLFQGLSSEQRKRLSRLLRPLFVVPGEVIVRHGERGDGVYFISSGAVEVALPEHKVRLGRGDFFGEMALMESRRRVADVTALTYCQLLKLDQADFDHFLQSEPAIREQIMRTFAHRAAQNVSMPA